MKIIPQYISLMVKLLLMVPLLTHSEIMINEVDADTLGQDQAEFIELFDGGRGYSALDGLSLVFFNGNTDTSYLSIDLDGKTTDAEGYFVLCADALQVEHCDWDISPDTHLIQNGADAIALYRDDAENFPDKSALTTEHLIDAFVYGTDDGDDTELLKLLNAGQVQVNESSTDNKDTESNQRCGNGSGGLRNTSSYRQALPTPGKTNRCPTPIEFGECGDPATHISQIQGHVTDMLNSASPLKGLQVVVEALVTTDLQGGKLANGDQSTQYRSYWLQEESADYDNTPLSSEGIRVYDSVNDVKIADKIRIAATVSEFNGVTQLSKVTQVVICSNDNLLPEASEITLPADSLLVLESREGMLVSNVQTLLVSDLFGSGYGFGNYGQFAVSSELLFQPTEVAFPGSIDFLKAVASKKLNYLLIDDGVSAPYPSYIPFPDESGFSALNPMRVGYQVTALTGVLDGYRDTFMVIPDNLSINPNSHPRTEAPYIDDKANLVIVAMNVLNYFNGNGDGGGFPSSRGAKTASAFEWQKAKIVAALQAMQADIIALMEIENDGYSDKSAINDLVEALNATQAAGNGYQFIQPQNMERLGKDEIAVGLLYRFEKISLAGVAKVLDSSNSPSDAEGVLFDDDKNRPSLIQSFTFNDFTFTLSVNHFKSKGSPCYEPNEDEDGQGNCNISRTRAAKGLVEFLATAPTGVSADAVMILGDLNAYSKEDPIQILVTSGYKNLKYSEQSTEKQPYSFSFNGFLGSLDHAMATDDFVQKVVSVDAWHINSVEDTLMDYATEDNGHHYDSIDHYANNDAYRSSDHDPLIVALHVGKNDTGSTSEPEPKVDWFSGAFSLYMFLGLLWLVCSRRLLS